MCRRFKMYIYTRHVTSMISYSSPLLLEVPMGSRKLEGLCPCMIVYLCNKTGRLFERDQ